MLSRPELVLFHCTFIALKARNNLTVNMDPREYKFPNEKRLFQAYVSSFQLLIPQTLSSRLTQIHRQIIDDGYQHSLIVYEDTRTRGMRLHAAVWDGELRACPVWTAFGRFGYPFRPHHHPPFTTTTSLPVLTRIQVTHQSASSRWLTRKSKHCVWINEIKLYVFCDKYNEAKMRRNKVGAFEIHFVSDEGTLRYPSSPPDPLPQQSCCSALAPARRLSFHAEERRHKTAAGRFKEVFYPPPASEPPGDGD